MIRLVPLVSSAQFLLVATDAAGAAYPLPAELGPLPLHPEDDGSYSVLGPPPCHATPVDQANRSNGALAYRPINLSATLAPPGDKVFCGSSRCSGKQVRIPSYSNCALILHID